MTGSPPHEDDPDLEDIRGLRRSTTARSGWAVAILVLLGVGLALWAYLR